MEIQRIEDSCKMSIHKLFASIADEKTMKLYGTLFSARETAYILR